MADLNNPAERNMSPSLSMTSSSGQRYPNQFFDLAQQYMPPTIKELFRWCTFYFYNNPLIGAAMKKVARYPITDLIFEDELESNRSIWEQILIRDLKIKERQMEINLDLHVYGNAFASLHLPFVRWLICPECKHRQPIKEWDWNFRGSDFHFSGKCPECGYSGSVEVKDVSYKDRKGIRIIRWNPENMNIKFNEYTGRYTYMYSLPNKLRNLIMRGDKDILEDLPLIVLDALKKRRMIRFHTDSLFHFKAPTLAEQDQGWGKPAIMHVLKDMYYFYTLRRAQEAIALEHIVPFDMIYPLPNAQQDPFIHTDLASWRLQIEGLIKKHRRDPNFKAVIPVPVGFGRLGGDGKALLLAPEINYLTQTIVGGMGIPQEFLFGGLNYTGSSINLRTLENDFIQNRSQIIDFTLWVKDRIRVWLSLPNIHSIRMSDFRMADDVQKNQQAIGLNAQNKISDQTLLDELGYDYDQEIKKIIEEAHVRNYINDLQTKGMTRTQGESQLIQFNYQQKLQELTQKAQETAAKRIASIQQTQGTMPDNIQPSGSGGGMDQDFMRNAQPDQIPGQQTQGQKPMNEQVVTKIEIWARQIMKMDQAQAQLTLSDLKSQVPEIGAAIEKRVSELQSQPQGRASGQGQNNMNVQPNMSPLPERSAPRRAEAM
jgi:hypothetical protein